jgi:SAM-dependent methyltransferase
MPAMNIFQSGYANYYDLFYKDKNYRLEAAYVADLIRRQQPGASSILELGCGSGRHADCFVDSGFSVVGVDISAEMIRLATTRERGADRPTFMVGDIRQIRLDSTFEAVVSLFHVMSYQTSHQDLDEAFATARSHLGSGGLFIFDFWYGPAVLTDRPVVRAREFSGDGLTVVRIAEPTLLPGQNLVQIDYTVFSDDGGQDRYLRSSETHILRYFFEPELQELGRKHGFAISFLGWMSDRAPDLSTWYATAICRVL